MVSTRPTRAKKASREASALRPARAEKVIKKRYMLRESTAMNLRMCSERGKPLI